MIYSFTHAFIIVSIIHSPIHIYAFAVIHFYCDYLFSYFPISSLIFANCFAHSYSFLLFLLIHSFLLYLFHFLMHSHFFPLSIFALSAAFPYRHIPRFIFIPIQRVQSLANHKFQMDNSSSKKRKKKQIRFTAGNSCNR